MLIECRMIAAEGDVDFAPGRRGEARQTLVERIIGRAANEGDV